MNTVSKIALGVALAGVVSGFIGSTKLIVGGLVVAVVAWAIGRYISPWFTVHPQ